MRRLLVRRERQRVWFRQWIREGYSVRQLAAQSHYGTRSLWRVIHYWLGRPPAPRGDLSGHRHLLVDSTYLCGHRLAVTVVLDATTNRVITGAYDVHESSSRMVWWCAVLATRGLHPVSITTDGHPHLLAALRAQWPEAVLQRCLVHVQRQGLSWCRQHPKRPDARALRWLFQQLTTIHTPAARDRWLDQLIAWEQRYGSGIAISPEYGYVFSDLKRARSMLVNALSDLFHHLETPGIATTTNGLEGYFSRLKMRYRQHRGLTPDHRRSYFEWYLHLCQT